MILILEGVDLAGKSTVAEALARRLKTEVIHHGPPRSDLPLIQQYSREIEAYQPGSGQHLVFDRLHVGEGVYGPIKRGSSLLSEAQFEWFQLLLDSRGAVVISMLPPLEVVRQRYLERGDEFVNLDELEEVWRGYDQLFGTARVTHTVRDSLDVDWAMGLANIFELSVLHLADFPSYGGPPRVPVLFIGDSPGRAVASYRYSIAFGPYPNTCGEHLFRAISKTGLPFFGLSNSDGVDVRGLWNALRRPRVVALGNLASQRLEKARVPHAKVVHPQHAKRFKARERARYVRALADIRRGTRTR